MELTYDNYLAHYGIKGMKWGVRRSDEELNRARSSRDEKKTARREKAAGKHDKRAEKSQAKIDETKAKKERASRFRQKSLDKKISALEQEKNSALEDAEAKRQGKMTKHEKKVAIGASIAATAIVAYGAYKVYDTGEYNRLAMKGKSIFDPSANTWKKNSSLADKDLDVSAIHSKVVKRINPDYGSPGSKVNCRRCTFAYEMSRRGYDVKATKTNTGSGQTIAGLVNATTPGAKNIGILGYVSEAQKKRNAGEGSGFWGKDSMVGANTVNKSGGDYSSDIFNSLAKQPNGARGELGMQWSMGGGHSMAWEIVKGKPVVFDTQTGDVYDSPSKMTEIASGMKKAGFTRLDNIDLDEDYLKRWVRNAQ